tara:strand:+ start:3063 stop:4478 length:1416 start_codon:yes stop_codon:yes gene_type:complete
VKMKKLIITLFTITIFVFYGCENFLTGESLDSNPNKVDDVDQISVESLFVGSQVTLYGVMEGYLSRLVTMFMQQLGGQLYSHADDYKCSPLDWRLDDRWSDLYGTGGLVDLRTIQQKANTQEKHLLKGVSQLWEALVFSTAADLWGKLPYSQAASSLYAEPEFDSQSSVHDAITSLIDDAIENIELGQDFSNLNDFTFNGDQEKWISCAYTLQARIKLNWAEVNGVVAYTEALALAQKGISDPSGSGDWKPFHRAGSDGEESIWHQFFSENLYVMGAGLLLVDMLKKDNDGRLTIYFDAESAFNDTVVGISPSSLIPPYASQLNEATIGSESWGVEWVSWHENQFIIAECQYNLGQEGAALLTLNNILETLEQRWKEFDPTCELPRYTGTSGPELLASIMNEKYKAMFLNMQTLSDWRRTGYPVFNDSRGNSTECDSGIPRRLLYPELEKKTNSNVPTGDSIFDRVENDPN